MARLQLDFTTVKSPLDGRAGLRLVDPGSIVHATDPGGLVTITQMQPIAALFTLSQDDLPAVLAAMARGRPSVAAYSRDCDRLLAAGKLVFVDSQVDQATGQVRVEGDVRQRGPHLCGPANSSPRGCRVRTIKNATVMPLERDPAGREPAPMSIRIAGQHRRGAPGDRRAGERRRRHRRQRRLRRATASSSTASTGCSREPRSRPGRRTGATP